MLKRLRLRKLIVTLILAAFLLPLFPADEAQAAMEAMSSYVVNINVLESGEVEMTYKISLENQSKKFFIRDYSLISDHSDLFEVNVKENNKQASFTKEHVGDKVRIRVLLKKELIYLGDKVDITIRYKTGQLYKKQGFIQRIYVPTIKSEEDLIEARFNLNFPEVLGNIDYVSLKDADFQMHAGKYKLSYSQKDAPKGLVIHLGDFQQQEFNYKYRIENALDKERIFSITLPPDSYFQNVYFLDISELPLRALTDLDGNNIVEYKLDPHETKEVRISGFLQFRNKSVESELSEEATTVYTSEAQAWKFPDGEKKNILEKITRPDYTNYENARFIYDYLVSDEYSSRVSKKKTGTESLFEYSGDKFSCKETSDQFVAFLRSVGIPSREAVGTAALRENLQDLHWWVEFYDDKQNRWIGVDPCIKILFDYHGFDNLDLERTILAYRGVQGDSPDVIVPFTDYQNNGVDNLEIRSSNYDFEWQGDVDIGFKVGSPDLLFNNVPLVLSVQNNAKSILHLDSIVVDGKIVKLMPSHREGSLVESVFPGDSASFSVDLSGMPELSLERVENYELKIESTLGERKDSKTFYFDVSRPFSKYHALSWLIACGLAGISLYGFIIMVRKSRKIQILKRPEYKFGYRKSKMSSMIDSSL
ncbi:MAG: transglutaminase-like domain-containing protein [Patescibacteria group bacterium]|nr:transglutaminase-like domain-containing protein [Patescibacteria group bacterium]